MAPPSSSSYARNTYDVFLSFRGVDSRESFIDRLYYQLRQGGVNVFRDDEKLQIGGSIAVSLLQAIQESRISVIIFSKKYAESSWCLDELATIMECKERLNQHVLPVFYDVHPSEVRQQTGEFGYALAEHQKRHEYGKVNRWKVSLTAAASLSGWDLQTMADWSEPKVIEGITNDVLRALNFIMPMNVEKYPIGIDSRVRDILHLLQTQTNDDVKIIGIFGMGGIGKSTLARAIYNHLITSLQGLEGCCFVADIREVSNKGHSGLVHLQEKLLYKTLRTKKFGIDNVEEGKNLIKEELQSKRVLIVLDGIDDINQLESLAGQRNWFGWGSIVIITTRNENLLRDDLIKAHEKYKVETLSSDESLQLLSSYAFGVPVPPKEYTDLSKIIVSYTDGLPLALTVLGNHLNGRSVKEWSNAVNELVLEIPHDNIQKTLMISYDALDDDTQNIFLDIACFFIGLNKNDIVQDFGVGLETGIRTLIDRCFLTIHRSEEKEKLQMHPLLREMAVEIVRLESPRDPSKRSRLMDPNDVYHVIKGNKGTEAIEGLYVDSSMLKNEPLSIKVLSRMKNLRLLKLNGVHLNGSLKHLPKALRWFWWHNCPLKNIPSDFCHEKLEVLHLQGSNIRSVQLKMKHFKSLRILNLGGCEQLEETPNFTGAQNLQILSFKYCKNLVKLPSSIGCLERLIELDLAFCEKLRDLPISFSQLKSLEFLYLNDCSSLQKFSFDLGKLEELRKLFAHSTNISLLPTCLGDLTKLKILSVGWRKDLLPPPPKPKPKSKSKSFDIISLVDTFFPHTVGDLCSLEALYITDNHLADKELLALERLCSLKVLSLKGSYYLQSFPFSLCSLYKLESLELKECPDINELLHLPPSLLKLSAKDCPSLRKIDISNLERLKELYIPNCKSLVELPGVESLHSIQRLDITNCSALTIPLIESCYQAYSKGGDVEIWLQMVGSFLYCTIPSVVTPKFFDIIHGEFGPNNYTCEACIIVRSRTTGALTVKKVDHVDCMCLDQTHPLKIHFKSEDDIVINTSERFHFKVRIKVGEELEVYAVLRPLKIFSLCVLHRNSRDGEVRFFPSTKGFLEFVEVAAESTEIDRHMEEVGKKESRVQIHEIIEDSPSPEEQQFPGQDETVSAVVSMKPRIDDENTSSEQIQKLLDETTRLVEEGSKLKRSISEFLDVALPRSKEAATTPELSALLNMLKVQSKGGYVTALEMTQCLLEALKNYEVELTIKKEVDVSSDDSQPTKKSNNNEGRLPETFKGIDYDKVVELFFTPKKFEGLVVVKLGEAIEVTGTGMYSLKPGEMIQDDVINSYEFILRERAGSEPKCWYLPTYICQETQANYSVKMYERNFKPYVINNSSCDIIYLPLFLNSHWYLVKANTKSRQAFILDSSITYNQIKSRLDEAKKIVGVLHNLLKEHTRRDPTYQYEANFNDWKYETASWVPQQGNGVDCGAFVMLFMEMDMDDQLKKHTGFNIDMERRRIALELLYHPRNARLSSVLENL